MITTHTDYYEAKKQIYALHQERNESQEKRYKFDDLLHDIVQFEIKSGIINENDIKDGT